MRELDNNPEIQLIEGVLRHTVSVLTDGGAHPKNVALEMLLLSSAALVVIAGEADAAKMILMTADKAESGDLVTDRVFQ